MGPALATATLVLLASAVQGGEAVVSKACAFNDRVIPCRDSHDADGSVHLIWRDGLTMTDRLIAPGFPVSRLRDALGGLWTREILPQGNAVFLNPANGNRVVVPLR
jgi:hypothetical protein